MKTISGIEFASEHNGTDVFRLIELAYEQGQKDGHSEQLGTNLAEVGTDCISKQQAIDALCKSGLEKERNGQLVVAMCESKQWAIDTIEQLPSAQPEIIRCKDCKHWMPYEWMFSEVWQSQNIDDYQEDEISCNYCDVHMKSSDFCSQAVRREDG